MELLTEDYLHEGFQVLASERKCFKLNVKQREREISIICIRLISGQISGSESSRQFRIWFSAGLFRIWIPGTFLGQSQDSLWPCKPGVSLSAPPPFHCRNWASCQSFRLPWYPGGTAFEVVNKFSDKLNIERVLRWILTVKQWIHKNIYGLCSIMYPECHWEM